MFNTAGELVGIPTLKYTGTRYLSSATVESIGMCIPINEAKDVIEKALNNQGGTAENSTAAQEQTEQAESTGDLKGKPRMGVSVTTLRNTNGLLPNGAYVISVEEGSPAEQAGLQAGDIMVELNGEVISSVSDEIRILEQLKEGDQVAVTVFRPSQVQDAERGAISTDGSYVDLTVTLAMIDAVAQ